MPPSKTHYLLPRQGVFRRRDLYALVCKGPSTSLDTNVLCPAESTFNLELKTLKGIVGNPLAGEIQGLNQSNPLTKIAVFNTTSFPLGETPLINVSALPAGHLSFCYSLCIYRSTPSGKQVSNLPCNVHTCYSCQ